MKNMTLDQMQSRLAEIIKLQLAHDKRDFDNELKEMMLAGGDVDALEEAQLQAERQARRLRVEHDALMAAIPEAERAEIEKGLNEIKAEMDKLPKRFKELVKQAGPLVDELWPLLKEIQVLNKERIQCHKKVKQIVAIHDLPESSMSGTGQIVSNEFNSIAEKLKEALSDGIDSNDFDEQLKYTTGHEYLTYKTII